MELNKNRKTIYFIILTAMFTALTFVGTYVSIPLGISKIHLGNFVCIIAGLLCGGLIGGISGSLGMGLNDILSSYGPDTVIRTFIVKFIVGFIAGSLFRYLVKKEKKIGIHFIILSISSFILFITSLCLFIINGEKTIIGSLTLKNSLLLVISLGVIAFFFLFISLFYSKINNLQKYVLEACSIACLFNILLEFFLKIPLKMIFASMSFEAATIYATSSLPGALLTAILTTIAISLIYIPVYFATRRFNKLDNLYENIQKITSLEKK